MVMLLPNGVSAFRFADAMSYDNESMVLAAEAIRPFCTPATSAVAAPPRTLLTAAEIRTEVTGHTFYSGRGHTFFDASGLIYSGSPDSVDVGRWSITAEGQFCRTWERVGQRQAALVSRVSGRRDSSSTRSIDGSSGPPGAYPAIRSATDPSPLRKTAWPRGAYRSSGNPARELNR